MMKKESRIDEACPFPPNTSARLLENGPSKKTPSIFTFNRLYIAVSICLLLVVPTVILFGGDTGQRSKLIGEVSEVKFSNSPFQHTTISYAIQTLKGTSNSGTIELNGDLRDTFRVGGYYNVTLDKKPFAIYPSLAAITELTPVTREVIINSVGSGFGSTSEKRLSSYTLIGFGSELLELSGDYQGLFESGGYYKITYFGDQLIECQKLFNPYYFYVSVCDLTNYDSLMILTRIAPGDVTIVGVEVDGVTCTGFTPAILRSGELMDFTFQIKQAIEKGNVYSVGIRLDSGEVRSFRVEGKNHGSVDLYA
jgi:hypothetical protein